MPSMPDSRPRHDALGGMPLGLTTLSPILDEDGCQLMVPPDRVPPADDGPAGTVGTAPLTASWPRPRLSAMPT